MELNNLKQNDALQVFNYGLEKCQSKHTWGPGVKDHIKIHIVYSGHGVFETNDRHYKLSQGNAFVIYPEMRAFYQADENLPWEYGWFAFDGLLAMELLDHTPFSHQKPVISLDASHLSESKALIKGIVQWPGSAEIRNLNELQFLYHMISLLSADKKSKGKNSHSHYVEFAIQYMQMNYSRKMSISELAEYIGIHRKYLTKLFRDKMGIPPQAYLGLLRMDRAKQMLIKEDLSIKEIAISVGYDDALVFSKAFKQIVGEAPTIYRKMALKKL